MNARAPERLVAMLSTFIGEPALLLAGIGPFWPPFGGRSRWAWVFGVVGCLWVGRFISSLSYGLEARDPVTLVSGCAVLSGVALIAGWLPAYRAARIDPVVLLRDARAAMSGKVEITLNAVTRVLR